jgi:hypothetical protein
MEADASWITIARLPATRQSLCSRLCLVWRISVEDTFGRVVESRLVGTLIELNADVGVRRSPSQQRARLRPLLPDIEDAAREMVHAGSNAWRDEVSRVTGDFWRARLHRERGVTRRPAAVGRGTQPGLFDRRATRAEEALASALAETDRASAERLTRIAASAQLVCRRPQLLLVLLP